MQALAIPPRLAGYVRSLRVFPERAAPTTQRYLRLPDGEAELLVVVGDGPSRATLVGPRTHPLDKRGSHRHGALLLRFRPGGAAPFFGRPICELTDRLLPMETVWPAELWEPLAGARDAAAAAGPVLAALTRTLESTAVYDPATAPAIRRAVAAIAVAPRLPRVRELAAAIGLSERQLRRGFDEVVGHAPKRYLRIVRVRRALRAARGMARPDWAAIAEREGYFDQAHLIADFRELLGSTPGALVTTARG